MYFFCDEEWEKAKTTYTCVEKTKLARVKRVVELHDSGEDVEVAKKLAGGDVSAAGRINAKLTHAIRTHYWYAFGKLRRSAFIILSI